MENKSETVHHPKHYKQLPLETIDIIRISLIERYGKQGYEAYCFGNEMKYRCRAGFKGDAVEDIGKALKYCEFRKKSESEE
jgi:hypothetical protein